MKKLISFPIAILGLFLLVRFVIGLIVYPPAVLLVIFFPISLLFNFEVALIMEAHLFGMGICFAVVSALLSSSE